MSVVPCTVRMQSFEVIEAQSHAFTGTSASLYAPLSFTIGFKTNKDIIAPVLFASLDFIADVASEQPPVPLVPLNPVAPADFVTPSARAAVLTNTVTLSPCSSSSAAAAEATCEDSTHASPLLNSDVEYVLTFTVADLSMLRVIPLKHLLQVSMMRVHLLTGSAGMESEAKKAIGGHTVATWNVVWHVRRDPQHDQKLVRTVLDPLA